MVYTPGHTPYHGNPMKTATGSQEVVSGGPERAMHLTREQFIHRLICAGWTPEEAESEWTNIDSEPEEDWEGQL